MKHKIVWFVEEAPTGPFRSFNKRGWPTAWYNGRNGKPVALLNSEDAYVPARVKTGNHSEIKVTVCHHNHPEAGNSWKTFTLKKRFATLNEAKAGVVEFFTNHEDWLPLLKEG